MKKNILITGKNSRFFKFFKKDKYKNDFNFYLPNRKTFDITKYSSMMNYLKKKKIHYILHIAGLSTPMITHEKKINNSIDVNIIGTANVVKICEKFKIKLIHFSTNYVYSGNKGKFNESDPLKPFNNYGWSKLGAECSVHMLKKFLILRLSMTDYPFSYKSAIKGAYASLIFNSSIANIIMYLIDYNGILNVGGKRREIYEFAKIFSKKKIGKINIKNIKNYPKDTSIDITKFRNILKTKRINEKIIL